MNHFIEYVCRSVMRSEDAICRLNKKVAKLAKCTHNTNKSVACIGIGVIALCSVVWMQDNEIKKLQKQVSELAEEAEPVVVNNTVNTEEQNQQEGA